MVLCDGLGCFILYRVRLLLSCLIPMLDPCDDLFNSYTVYTLDYLYSVVFVYM